MRTAIVTLAIGSRYLRLWKELCEPSWRAYASRCGFDIILVDQPLDKSPRAIARSPAWQKCLILEPAIASAYDRIVWMDCDIVISRRAPAIGDDVPIEKIGVTDEMSIWTLEERQTIVERMSQQYKSNVAWVQMCQSYRNPDAYHQFWGLPSDIKHIIQTGVMVLSPRHHRQILEHVYYSYDDKGSSLYNYEMRPLSYEIQTHGLHHLIDPQFNSLLTAALYRLTYCHNRKLSTLQEAIDFCKRELTNCYFLHFAGPKVQHEAIRVAIKDVEYEECQS